MARVSVVTATYNRSGVLRLAIDTVMRQTLADWELLVVGDACTDESGAVVAGFADARVRWLNLPQRVGEQSGPNNEGTRLAGGEYVAFLNHDDLWFADHLECCVAELERTGADLVFAFGAALHPIGRVDPVAASPEGTYALHMSVPATCWVLRRSAAEAVGPWRPAAQCWGAPSQDWLRRAHRLGLSMRQSPSLTAVLLRSGERPGSYLDGGPSEEHRRAHASVTGDPGYRERIASDIAIRYSALRSRPRPVHENVKTLARDLFLRSAVRLGANPADWRAALRYRRRGGYMEALTHRRGLKAP